jgi:hypothetical protein
MKTYSILLPPGSREFRAGEIFTLPETLKQDWRYKRFEGLRVHTITQGYGSCLHFDLEDVRNKDALEKKN